MRRLFFYTLHRRSVGLRQRNKHPSPPPPPPQRRPRVVSYQLSAPWAARQPLRQVPRWATFPAPLLTFFSRWSLILTLVVASPPLPFVRRTFRFRLGHCQEKHRRWARDFARDRCTMTPMCIGYVHVTIHEYTWIHSNPVYF